MKTLSHFLPNEYERMMKDEEFWKNKFELDLAKLKSGTERTYSIEELDVLLEETISKYEVKTVQEDADFIKNKREVEKAYAKMKSGTEKFYTIEEVDEFLDETFSEYDS